MIYVAIAALAALTVGHFFTGGVIRYLLRQHHRERELLLNQIMHLSGKTWAAPPAEKWQAPAEPDDPDRYVASASGIVEDF